MNWITELIWGNGIAHTVLLLAFVIATGIALGKIKVGGISLGIAMVLFSGIAFAHFGFRGDETTLAFIKEFGLILFVYAIGLQVGPGFFASLKKGGILLNLFALGIVMLGVITTLVIYSLTDLPISTLVGILSGAVTNTPGLGAAQEAYTSLNAGKGDPNIALGYAVAYPLGVTGIIFSIIILRIIFRVNFSKEKEKLDAESIKKEQPSIISMEVRNPAIFGKNIESVTNLINREFVISRIMHAGKAETASSETVLNEGDKVIVVAAPDDVESIAVFIGRQIDMSVDDWNRQGTDLLSRRILITQPEINGKALFQLNLRHRFGVNVTRVNRSGIDLVAHPDLKLIVGDLVTVVGTRQAIAGAEKVLGNEMKRLNEPNLIPIFIGISLGVLVGSIPFSFPGVPQPVRLGLAGGPLIVAILMSYFGTRSTLVTYTTLSANLMVREIGICLFLACVGLDAGKNFVETIISTGGLNWIGFGVIIAIVPLLIAGIIARYFFQINYFTLMGLLAGSTTDPPALSYATYSADNDHPTVSYASVYPLTMFLRVMSAQLLILLFS
jgi:putative transport protein